MCKPFNFIACTDEHDRYNQTFGLYPLSDYIQFLDDLRFLPQIIGYNPKVTESIFNEFFLKIIFQY